MLDTVAYLHSLRIVHRDLMIWNILESDLLVICNLQRPPLIAELLRSMTLITASSLFSFAGGVFALGKLLWECCFYNSPQNRHVVLDNPPPPLFREILLVCTQVNTDVQSHDLALALLWPFNIYRP